MKYLLLGLIGGIIGGMGMGGGTLLIPLLTIFLGVEQKSAQLINIISFIPMAILTTYMNSKKHLINIRYILYVSVSGTLAAIGTSFLVGSFDSRILKISFGVFLIVIAVCFITSTIVKAIVNKRRETLVSVNITKGDDDAL